MAVTLKGNNGTYEGTSEDSKPLDVPVNTEFNELDTGKTYYFDGETWNEEPPCEGSGFTPTAEQLAAMNSGINAEDVEQITTNKNNILSQQNSIAQGGQGYAIINGQRLYMGETIFGTNVPTYSIGYFGGLQYSYRAATDVITPPTTIYADGTTATFALKGNGVNGVGEFSANLFDGNLNQGYYAYHNGAFVSSEAYICTNLIECEEDTNYAFSCINENGGSKNYGFVFFDSNQNRIGDDYIYQQTSGNVITKSTTTPHDCAYFAINVSLSSQQSSLSPTDISAFMLNEGLIALPYIPYGIYYIPLTINSTTTNIFIGDNPLRKSLDGTAVDELVADGTLTRRVDSDGSVLATPVVTQITMPTFTTADGANAISIDTTVQPSEVSATWTGWHLL